MREEGWRRAVPGRTAGGIPPRRGDPGPGRPGPGIAARRGPGAVTAAPRAARGPFASRHLHPSALRSRGRASTSRTGEKRRGRKEKRILPGAEGLLSVRDGEERLLAGQRLHQREGLAAQQRRHRGGGGGGDGAPEARPLRLAELGPGGSERTSGASGAGGRAKRLAPGAMGEGRGERAARTPASLRAGGTAPRPWEQRGTPRGEETEGFSSLLPAAFHLTPISAAAAAGHDSSPAGHGRKLLKNGGRFPSSPPLPGQRAH